METPEERYIREHSEPESDALRWITRETFLRTHYPRMLCGHVQGRLLTLLVQVTGARRVLEIGTFTGYATVCLASGLPEDGVVDTYEIDEERESLIREGISRAGLSGRINLHIGDFLKADLNEDETYDLVYIDGNKREYPAYLQRIVPILKSGGLILADDTLWDGKPFAETVPEDAQTRGICRFNELVAADPYLEAVILPLRHGLTLLRKKR